MKNETLWMTTIILVLAYVVGSLIIIGSMAAENKELKSSLGDVEEFKSYCVSPLVVPGNALTKSSAFCNEKFMDVFDIPN